MGKTKVYELAKELGMSNAELTTKLGKLGIEVKCHLSVISDDDVIKVKSNIKKYIEKEGKKNMEKPQVHIIRRNVKVIKTDGEKSEVEEISTNVSGEIKKSHHTVGDTEKRKENYNNTESNGTKNRQPYSNPRNKFAGNRNTNVVITRNGKPMPAPDPVQKEEEKEVSTESNVSKADNTEVVNSSTEVKSTEVRKPREYNNDNRNRSFDGERSNNYNRDGQNNNYQRSNNYNRDGQNNNQTRPNNYNRDGQNNYQRTNNYNRDGQNSQPRTNNYNRDGQNNYQRPNNYNRDGQNNTQRPNNYNRDGQNNYQRPNNYNRDGQNNTQRPNNYNRDGQNNYQRPNNYNRDGQNNYQRPNNYNRDGQNNYQNRPNSGYNNGPRRPNTDNTSYQVNRFMKQEGAIPVEQKETREYSNNIIDKKKYNNDKNVNDAKKEKIDKNKLREEHSRVSTSKLKGLEVDSSSEMLDLYVRESDTRRAGSRRKPQKQRPTLNQTKIIPMTEVKLPELMLVKEFAEAIKKQASEVIKKLFSLGILATVNQEIDFDTAYLIAQEFGITAEKQVVVKEEDILFDDTEDDEKDLTQRPPIVVVMGHVDHGKTSLLDRIRSESVVTGEAGGITQHIGAYKVKCKDKEICFLDTPGHEAFTAMRARGAQVTDIAVIVVAADDGIKPQTIEAIDHAKAAGVSIIVAINKIDKPTANVDRVKQELLEVGLVAEEWGGDTICVPISAMTGEGIETLLEMILLVAEMKDLKANPNKQAKGTVLEARLDKSSGTTVSMLIQRGQLNVGDTIVVGDIIGKIRAMKDDKGRKVKMAGPSTPVEIIGLSQVPQTGDVFYEVENEKVAKHLVEKRRAEQRVNLIKQGSKVTLDDLFGQIKEGKLKDLNIIIKADVQGSVEALKDSLEKLSNEQVRVRILHASTGGIKESDVTLASVSNAIIIGFNVRPEAQAAAQAEKEKVDLRLYRVIYDAIDDVQVALKGMLPKKYKEIMYGTCEVRRIFKITGVGIVAGCYVKSGKIVRGTMVRLVRDSIVIFEIKIDSLKREKDDVKEVAEGYECGIRLEKFNDIKEGDIFECFDMQEEKSE